MLEMRSQGLRPARRPSSPPADSPAIVIPLRRVCRLGAVFGGLTRVTWPLWCYCHPWSGCWLPWRGCSPVQEAHSPCFPHSQVLLLFLGLQHSWSLPSGPSQDFSHHSISVLESIRLLYLGVDSRARILVLRVPCLALVLGMWSPR